MFFDGDPNNGKTCCRIHQQDCKKRGLGCFSPSSVVTLSVSYGKGKGPVENRYVASGRLANSLLFTVRSCLSKSSKCISTAQARKKNWLAAAGAWHDCALIVVIFGYGDHFSWQAQGKPRALAVQISTFCGVILRNADFVAGAALWTRWRPSMRSNFVTVQ